MTAETNEEEVPKIKFAGEWLPAHMVWDKLETAGIALETIKRFNENFPHLATETTKGAVPVVSKRLKNIEMLLPKRKIEIDLAGISAKLLEKSSPEDVIDILKNDYDEVLDLAGLISLAGEKPYIAALNRDAEELDFNQISTPQIAQLWNEAARPAPGGGLWNSRKVERLMMGDEF